MNVVVVEDDSDIREMVCKSLAQSDLQTIACCNLQEARQTLDSLTPACMVIDWMLPDGSGIELIRWLRRSERFRQVPVLMLTARAQEADLITGLDSGADDYLTKPMSLRELNARVRALLRRPAPYKEQHDLLAAGSLQMNLRSHEVSIDGTPLELTPTEFKLLKLFLQNPRQVFSREKILDFVWGRNAFLGDRTVDVHILRLRKLLKPHGIQGMIETVRGSGYRLTDS